MPRFKDQAICIRLIDWSETSQIVVLLTERHGNIRAVAKGAKRTSPSAVARYSGGLGLLTGGQAVGVIKRNTDLATLTEWDLQAPYWHLHQDLTAQRLGCYAADLAQALIPDLEPHPAAFRALRDLLEALVEPGSQNPALLRFQWRLLDDCGYRPRLEIPNPAPHESGTDSDPAAGSRRYVFDPHGGSLTGQAPAASGGPLPGQPVDNGRTVNNRWTVREGTIRALHAVDRGEELISDMGQNVLRANRLLCAYARTILDRELPTMRYVLEQNP